MQTFTVEKSGEIVLVNPDDYQFILSKPDVQVTIIGRFAVKNSDQQQIAVTIYHKAPRTSANTSLRGTSADQAKLTFFGRIIIDPDCPQTNSFLEERILLLSPQARGETIPELEILSNDVKCSHAATISTLDENQTFYLQSRGLSSKKAEKMLIDGFLAV